MMRRYSTYLILFGNGYLYTGCTGNLRRRASQHAKGGTKPKVIWRQFFASREEALDREKQIKGWSRAKKLALAKVDLVELSKLSKRRAGKPRA